MAISKDCSYTHFVRAGIRAREKKEENNIHTVEMHMLRQLRGIIINVKNMRKVKRKLPGDMQKPEKKAFLAMSSKVKNLMR